MPYQIGEKINGFTVVNVRMHEEIIGSVVEMRHDETGAELVYVENGLKNKLFNVAFKTLPENSTGVFHILEHSVLGGSKKYPVREPFVELLKGSMNTFLNAMTYPDKTCYPVSSRNDRDFLNLVEVYLDAVFAPSVLTNPNIFYQEGWHFEQDENRTLTYKGVVYNEMKGAMSSVDEIISEKMLSLLFPDNCYGFNSGGDPKCIPELSYEAFVDTYNRFYHPSNARFFLDGAVPLKETLALIDGYIRGRGREENLPIILPQTEKFSSAEEKYEIGREEDIKNKAHLTFGKIICSHEDSALCMAADILCEVLAGSNEAPLKRTLLESGLCQDVQMYLDDSIAQPYLLISLRNVKDGCAEELTALLFDTVRHLAQGLDKEALTAAINRKVFRLKEPKEPQGLIRCLTALTGWLYGDDVLESMTFGHDVDAVRAMAQTDAFEQLLLRILPGKEKMCALLVTPDPLLGEKTRKEEQEALRKIAETWTDADFAENLKMTEALQSWQSTPDTREQLSTLPSLPLSEVDGEPLFTPTEIREVQGMQMLFHPAQCPGIVHVSAYFDVSDCSLEDLTALSLVGRFLGVLPTKKHSGAELEKQVKSLTGRLRFSVDAFHKPDEKETCRPMLVGRFSALAENLDAATELFMEILTETDFTACDRIAETLLQEDEDAKQSAVMGGHAIGMLAAASGYSSYHTALNALGGAPQNEWLHRMAENAAENAPAYGRQLAALIGKAACKERLTLTETAARYADLSALVLALPSGGGVSAPAAYAPVSYGGQGYRIPAQIGFACQAYGDASAPDGSAQVAANILSLSYLWNVVRVQGGAYGTGLRIDRSGLMTAYSYRDPTPGKTLEVYKGLADALKAFVSGEEDLEKFIISTVAGTEPLISPLEEGVTADGRWMSGITREMLRKERGEMLRTTPEKLLSLCERLSAFAQKGDVCVVAHEDALKAAEGIRKISDL